ncbi:MAG TPA: FtsX-like permease family protein [Sphingobacteriaceae bacterium]|nr:FtsX-like permease family protein [Sphingobacteriaceae bacterium]
MNIFKLAWQYIKQNRSTAILGVLLAAFGSAILCILMLTSKQLENQLDQNSRGIDLVVGAKGSPTQLILSSIYHVDNPTGNIRYAEAQRLQANPFVRLAVPLALGDNFNGHRIIGTDSTFLQIYNMSLRDGQLFENDFEAVIGADVAAQQGLKIGDRFVGAHGLSDEGHVHGEHPYVITGILERSGRLTDRLILTTISSVWAVHGMDGDDQGSADDDENSEEADEDAVFAHGHSGAQASVNKPDEPDSSTSVDGEDEEEEVVYVKNIMGDVAGNMELEITAMLIQYSNPAAIGQLPRMINQSTAMQAASPALESARLFSLLGVGIDSLELLAYVIMFMAAFSVFISLYNSFKNRKYDLAIMRTLGASRGKLFGIVIAEGIIITLVGAIVGLVLGHLAMYYIGAQAGNAGSLISAFQFEPEEAWLLLVGVVIGFLAAIIPALKAYNTSISQTLSETD